VLLYNNGDNELLKGHNRIDNWITPGYRQLFPPKALKSMHKLAHVIIN
jgi:hypothetical protein